MKDMEKENSIESRGEIVLYQPDEKNVDKVIAFLEKHKEFIV